jgi:hypothetical protein
MTKKEIWKFLEESDTELEGCGRFFFFSRGRELQEEVKVRLKDLRERTKPVLVASQKANFEDLSNRLRGALYHLDALIHELQMYLDLKNDEMSKAWDSLIGAQMGMLWSMRSHQVFREGLQDHSARLDAMEKLFFPRQIFFSTGMTIKSSECSICGTEYRDCKHIKGRIYNGEFCIRKIKDIDLKEVSVVEDPADKRCRATSFGEDGDARDTLTWRKIAKL